LQVEPSALSFDPAGAPAETTRIEPRSVSVGLVGTYPPTRCGIATFTASLREAMAPLRSGVVALVDEAGASPFAPEVAPKGQKLPIQRSGFGRGTLVIADYPVKQAFGTKRSTFKPSSWG